MSGFENVILLQLLSDLPIVREESLDVEARTYPDHIATGPKFDRLSKDAQLAVLAHEAAHFKGLDDWFLSSGRDWDLTKFLKHGHLNGQTEPGEVICEAWALMWYDPSFLEDNAPRLIPIVQEGARAVQLPLPERYRGRWASIAQARNDEALEAVANLGYVWGYERFPMDDPQVLGWLRNVAERTGIAYDEVLEHYGAAYEEGFMARAAEDVGLSDSVWPVIVGDDWPVVVGRKETPMERRGTDEHGIMVVVHRKSRPREWRHEYLAGTTDELLDALRALRADPDVDEIVQIYEVSSDRDVTEWWFNALGWPYSDDDEDEPDYWDVYIDRIGDIEYQRWKDERALWAED